MANYNNLSPAETERLSILAEECAEVIQVVGKILRHGFDSKHPDGGPDNRALLALEMGHVYAISQVISFRKDISADAMDESMANKVEDYSKRKYLHHQP